MAVNIQQLTKQGIFEAKSSLGTLLADLDQITTIANGIAAHKKTQGRIGGYVVVAGVLGAIAGAILSPLLLGLSIALMFCGIVFWLYAVNSGGKLIEHPKRIEVAKECLTMIQPDAKAERPFSLRLALTSKRVQLSHGDLRGRKNGKQELLEDAWLTVQGTLLDGTILTDEIKELIRLRTHSNPRGKRKTKSRITYLVSVRFSYPGERYGDARPAERALKGEVKVGPACTLRCVRVSEKAILLKAMATSEHDLVATTGMLSMGGYRILNLARKMAARQRGKAS